MPMRRFDVNPLILKDTSGMINLFERALVIHETLRCFFCLQPSKIYDDNNKPIIRHHKNCIYYCVNHVPFFMHHQAEINLPGNISPTSKCVDKYTSKIKLPNGTVIKHPRKPILQNNKYLRSNTIDSVFERKIVYTCKICHRTNDSYDIIEHAYYCLLSGRRYTEDRCNVGTSPFMQYTSRIWSFSGKKIQWGYTPDILAAFGFYRTDDQYRCMCGFSVNSQDWWGRFISPRDISSRNSLPPYTVSNEYRKIISSNSASGAPLTNIILEHILYQPNCVQLKSGLGTSNLADILSEIKSVNIEY